MLLAIQFPGGCLNDVLVERQAFLEFQSLVLMENYTEETVLFYI